MTISTNNLDAKTNKFIKKDKTTGGIKKSKLKDLKELVKKFKNITDEPNYTEADVGTKFIISLLEILGWDTKNQDEMKEEHRTGNGSADYVLYIHKNVRLVVESKRFTKDLDDMYVVKGKKETFPEQSIRYAWHLKSDWVILTNFKEIRLYYSRVQKAEDGLVFKLKIDNLLECVDDLFLISKENIISGKLEILQIKQMRDSIDKEILVDFNKIRYLLQDDIKMNNDNVSDMRKIIQILMNRLLVIRVSEDREIIAHNTLHNDLESWQKRGLNTFYMKRLKVLFSDFKDVYNTSLFETGIIDEIKVSNEVLIKVIDLLSKYNFDIIDADVLGSIYENYLTMSLMELEQTNLQIVDNTRERKERGIYYTPKHLVEYILEKTLGEKLKMCKTPLDVEQIKVLDPSCGSGSFLIKAFDIFMNWYNAYNDTIQQNTIGKLDGITEIINPEQSILKNNLFGVDIDPEAAEIASVNLMLKALKKGKKLESIFGHNIRIGNTLITGTEKNIKTDDIKNIKPFNWSENFPNIFGQNNKNKGFDVVIGNPPYFKVRTKNLIRLSADFKDVQRGPVNIAMMFINKSINLLKSDGMIGLVIPKMCSYTKGWEKLRDIIFSQIDLSDIVDCQEAFEGVLLEQILLIGKKVITDSNEYRIGFAHSDHIHVHTTLQQKLAKTNKLIFLESSNIAYDIRNKILNNSNFLKDSKYVTISMGDASLRHKKSWKTTGDVKMLEGKDIARYFITAKHYFDLDEKEVHGLKDKIDKCNIPHLVCQRIVAHIKNPNSHIILMFAYESVGAFAQNTITHIFSKKDEQYAYFLLGVLNSRLISYYTHKFIYCNAIRSMDLVPHYLGNVPIPNVNDHDMQNISSISKELNDHVKNERRVSPKITNYLIKPKNDAFTLRNYLETLEGNCKITKHKDLMGIIIKVYHSLEQEWIIFHCKYMTMKSKCLKDIELVRIRITDRCIREFLIQGYKWKSSKKSKYDTLFQQLLKTKTDGYGKSINTHFENLKKMLEQYIICLDAHNEWKKKFNYLEFKIDDHIFNYFSLDDDEIDEVKKYSRSHTWLNY